ncbi:MAG: HAD family hydrolase [Chloroflexi bacterium]|nr:HAD family hydrolase [Chloroflexota bacterium]
MLKAVLFDLDNTLIDWDSTGPWDEEIARRFGTLYEVIGERVQPWDGTTVEALQTCFIEELNDAWTEANRTLVPVDHMGVLRRSLAKCGVPEDRLTTDLLHEAYDWQPHENLQIYPEVPGVLEQLRAHGLALGIITNASQSMTLRDRELAHVRLMDYFPLCRISAIDVGYLKPDPRIFHVALDMLRLTPEQAIYVGDHLHADILGAQSAGMRAVWRANNADTAPPDTEIEPDGIVTDLRELLPLLDSWYPGWRNGHTPT